MMVIAWFLSLIERFKLAVQVLRKGLPKQHRETDTDKAVAEFISGQRKPGFDCPRCTTRIVVGIPDLLGNGIVQCGRCGLELRMDWHEDPQARRALQNIQAAAVQVEQARRFRG